MKTLDFEIFTVEKFFLRIDFGLLGVPKFDIPIGLRLMADAFAERILLFTLDLNPELIFLVELKALRIDFFFSFRGVWKGLGFSGSPFLLLSKEILG